jgi:hypothetical protein
MENWLIEGLGWERWSGGEVLDVEEGLLWENWSWGGSLKVDTFIGGKVGRGKGVLTIKQSSPRHLRMGLRKIRSYPSVGQTNKKKISLDIDYWQRGKSTKKGEVSIDAVWCEGDDGIICSSYAIQNDLKYLCRITDIADIITNLNYFFGKRK